jgi:hypothetical protein
MNKGVANDHDDGEEEKRRRESSNTKAVGHVSSRPQGLSRFSQDRPFVYIYCEVPEVFCFFNQSFLCFHLIAIMLDASKYVPPWIRYMQDDTGMWGFVIYRCAAYDDPERWARYRAALDAVLESAWQYWWRSFQHIGVTEEMYQMARARMDLHWVEDGTLVSRLVSFLTLYTWTYINRLSATARSKSCKQQCPLSTRSRA